MNKNCNFVQFCTTLYYNIFITTVYLTISQTDPGWRNRVVRPLTYIVKSSHKIWPLSPLNYRLHRNSGSIQLLIHLYWAMYQLKLQKHCTQNSRSKWIEKLVNFTHFLGIDHLYVNRHKSTYMSGDLTFHRWRIIFHHNLYIWKAIRYNNKRNIASNSVEHCILQLYKKNSPQRLLEHFPLQLEQEGPDS